MKIPASALGALALACAAPGALAQAVYKLQLADGRTAYADKVLPGSKVQREFTDHSSEISIIAPPASVASKAPARRGSQRVSAQLAGRDELWRQRDLAQGELDAALGAKANGAEPLPGERTANAGGGSRLNEAYWARQDALDRRVEGAQRNLERAQQRLREAGG